MEVRLIDVAVRAESARQARERDQHLRSFGSRIGGEI